jgi:hypothetical protein
MAEKTKVGIATHDQLRDRATQIARGERRRQPDEPKIWFTSLESLAKVLSEPNRRLLRIIDERHPSSLAELETLTGRKASNLSRTLKRASMAWSSWCRESAARSHPRCWCAKCRWICPSSGDVPQSSVMAIFSPA